MEGKNRHHCDVYRLNNPSRNEQYHGFIYLHGRLAHSCLSTTTIVQSIPVEGLGSAP